jgi:hypothetical protein
MTCLYFDNNMGRRIRLWFDEIPDDALLPRDTMQESYVFDGGAATVLRKRVAIEVFLPFGASFHYGLLGGEFHSNEGNALVVRF